MTVRLDVPEELSPVHAATTAAFTALCLSQGFLLPSGSSAIPIRSIVEAKCRAWPGGIWIDRSCAATRLRTALDRRPCGPIILFLRLARSIHDVMPETFILIPGRTSDQGCGISEGKFQEKYQTEINTLQMAPGDIERLGLSKGDRVRLTSESGQQVEVAIAPAKKDELPEGILFIAYGDISSRLMAGDTHGSGMPTSKGMDVTLEVIPK